MKIKYLSMLFFLISGILFSQTDSVLNFKLPEMDIYSKTGNSEMKIILNDIENELSISKSEILVTRNKYNVKIQIKDVNKIYLLQGGHFWTGAAIGAAAGFLMGFIAGGNGSFHGTPVKFNTPLAFMLGFIFLVPVSLLSGMIGAFIPDYEKYNLFNSTDSKYRRLIKMFRKNKI